MNVVGKVGSLISQGVYSVATPFHPFGGAVDVIVVEQQDGTYRSTPWYVRFGKFQGVLKGAEKIVTISVNGVDADFHMYLDNSGQAYFMREVVSGNKNDEDSGQAVSESRPMESSQEKNVDANADDPQNSYDDSKGLMENSEQSYRFQEEQDSPEDSAGSSGFSSYHYESLNEVEDLVKQSNGANSEMVLVSVDGHVLTAPLSSTEANTENVQLNTPQFHLGPGESSDGGFSGSGDTWEARLFAELDVSIEKNTYGSREESDSPKDHNEVTVYDEEDHSISNVEIESEDVGGLSKNDTFKSCLDLMLHNEDAYSGDASSLSPEHSQRRNSEQSPEISSLRERELEEQTLRIDSNFKNDSIERVDSEVEDFKQGASVDINQEKESANLVFQESDLSCNRRLMTKNGETEVPGIENESAGFSGQSDSSFGGRSMTENRESEAPGIETEESGVLSGNSGSNDMERLESIPESSMVEEECNQTDSPGIDRRAPDFGFEISLCGNLLRPSMGRRSAEETFDAHRISEEEFKSSGPSIIKDTNLIVRVEDKYLPWDKAAHVVLGKVVFGQIFSIEPKDAIPVEHEETSHIREETPGMSPSFSSRWRLWPNPFRRSRSLQHSNSNSSSEELFVDSESVLQSPTAEQTPQGNKNQSPRKQFMRTNIPTNEEMASLHLKEGQNMIAFSFCTRVLGKQKVDAHIYLWKWNARIVISDVDGTITKSDVLGQFMPLVGRDWTQSGVARLFCAIKENGYQLLFLSARAIVQAYLTRSFLVNLKQDGKALPNGPVVISPDGLFPSLYREVIRRAPHEFKIACLEDIRALFPSDYNPFYAGFGNRDTDELSYRKIGIPKGKIFIINPKGEVAINHNVDVKSYTSLHTLVNDMFPPTSLVEQEDFNSWNYWKMPLPNIEC
ncbi:phosphatidate phosphatase PAH1 isoform X1 [Typha angustifolia]|uniref:phosphatidate phosphatase PAH1 isoform X1 n=1 Tax=Typha angustifolia TaxID=59011 RepID=UPI003C2C0FAB